MNDSTRRIALCFSGHIRDFNSCYDSLESNFLKPLRDAGYEIHTFGVFWNVLGHRNTGWIGEPNFNLFSQKMEPKALLVEPFNRDFFLKIFSSNQWTSRPSLSCYTTSGDAASMWYGIYKCFKEIESYQSKNGFVYDVICRVRGDLIYNSQIDTREIDDIIKRDVIYMPKWHGKYYEVCHEVMDYFGMGNYKVMKQYLSTFENVGNYIKSNEYIHTGEGFLLAQLKDIEIVRTSLKFSIQRHGYIENVMS